MQALLQVSFILV